MSYLSASENVGFSGIPQNISDASCASQYKMAVEGVSGNCSEVMYIQDNIADDQTYITHLNENFYTKFKIDPNELYTFHDSDVIAGEITVSHTEDAFIFPESVENKNKISECPTKELDILGAFTNGDIKHEIKNKVVSNGHYTPISKPLPTLNYKDSKTTHTKVPRAKNQNQVKEPVKIDPSNEVRRLSVQSPKGQISTSPSPSNKNSINSVNTSNVKVPPGSKQTAGETFLDVFKREQGLIENSTVVKDELPAPPAVKVPTSPPKKTAASKTPAQAKARRGRGPALHEALQRIPSAQRRAIPLPNSSWHAPGDNLFDCGPLDNKQPAFKLLESSSSDDDNMPDFVSGGGAVCVEESAAESRGARLAQRRAALRRHVARAHAALGLARGQRDQRALAAVIKKQLNGQGSSCQLSTPTVNHLLAMRGMPAILSPMERRRLRDNGWSGGESGSSGQMSGACAEDKCTQRPLPCARYCFAHITLAPEQRLYAACAAVFAGGARCKQPLLPLQDQTPLCAEHAWKRDNYDKLIRDSKPKKVVRARVPPAPRRAKRRRRPPPARPRPPAPPPSLSHSLSEINVCSNSSTYDSSEDTAMGALSENEYITVASNSHGIVTEVGHVPPDDILDPAVLSQIPDEAFTEFFNQAGGGAPFAESAELAAALEAVLDERVLDERELDGRVLDGRVLDGRVLDGRVMDGRGLDERALDTMADCVFTHSPHGHIVKSKMQVRASVPMEMSSGASS